MGIQPPTSQNTLQPLQVTDLPLFVIQLPFVSSFSVILSYRTVYCHTERLSIASISIFLNGNMNGGGGGGALKCFSTTKGGLLKNQTTSEGGRENSKLRISISSFPTPLVILNELSLITFMCIMTNKMMNVSYHITRPFLWKVTATRK